MGRKRQKKSKSAGFKKGNVPHNKHARTATDLTVSQPRTVQINRLSQDVFDSRIEMTPAGILTCKNAEGTPSPMKILRPASAHPTAVDSYIDADTDEPDSHTYKLLMPVKIEGMWNTATREHSNFSLKCKGNLKFDSKSAKQMGWAWSEKLYCGLCNYRSQYFKLYEEDERDGVGRRRPTINTGIQTGLLGTPMGNTGLIELSLTSNIIPPSYSGLQKQANAVGSKIETENQTNMKEIRERIVEDNSLCGLEHPDTINIEGDSRYNNALFGAGERTPYQPATQSVYLTVANVGNSKPVISSFIGNKLCKAGEAERSVSGMDVTCPHHPGICTANIPQDFPIGDEETSARNCATDIQDEVSVKFITTDGDSKAFSGTRTVFPTCENLKDVRHLANSLKKALNKAPFSADMLKTTIPIPRTTLKYRFCLDVKARCVAELRSAHQKHHGDIDQIKDAMPNAIDAICMCYQDNCGSQCQDYSFVCGGTEFDHWTKNYLPRGLEVHMTERDEELLVECISILLKPASLESTRMQSSTQKCESVNARLQKTLPKRLTFYRNVFGRAHTAVHLSNHGIANSTVLRSQAAGAPLTKGSRVITRLVSERRRQRYHRTRQLGMLYKLRRNILRVRRFKMHVKNAADKYKNCVHYKSGLDNPKLN